MPDDYTVNKYDRLYAGLQDVSLWTRPSTIKMVQALTGKSETFHLQTARHADLGDYIFIEYTDEAGTVRLALPPKAANAIASQRDSLTARRRSITAKRLAQERKDRGELPGFMRKKKA